MFGGHSIPKFNVLGILIYGGQKASTFGGNVPQNTVYNIIYSNCSVQYKHIMYVLANKELFFTETSLYPLCNKESELDLTYTVCYIL